MDAGCAFTAAPDRDDAASTDAWGFLPSLRIFWFTVSCMRIRLTAGRCVELSTAAFFNGGIALQPEPNYSDPYTRPQRETQAVCRLSSTAPNQRRAARFWLLSSRRARPLLVITSPSR